MSADIVDVGFGVRVLHAGKDGWGVVDDAAEEADLYADMDKAILFAREIALEKAAERVLDQDAEIARLRAEVEALRRCLRLGRRPLPRAAAEPMPTCRGAALEWLTPKAG